MSCIGSTQAFGANTPTGRPAVRVPRGVTPRRISLHTSGRHGCQRNRLFATSGVFGLLIALALGLETGLSQEKPEVLVVGTLHQRHARNANYSYEDIVHILSTYDPDVVCVEIRPKEFRKQQYLKEMMIATIWGLAAGKKVYPIDWWNDTNDRRIRDSLSALPEYVEKEKRLKALEEKSPIIQAFEKEYGTWKDQGQRGYEFWNGKEYNAYTEEAYRISMEVYGDSPFNLHYRTRNDSMMALIVHAVRTSGGRKAIVLTGGEHKHYFDRAIGSMQGLTLVGLDDILPLRKKEFSPPVRALFEQDDDLSYYEEGYPQDLNTYYQTKMVPLVHGPDMDFNPDIIPQKNIDIAEQVLARWQRVPTSPDASDRISFEVGWVSFLKGDYDEAIIRFLPLTEKVESGSLQDPFLRHIIYRNIGFCYDLIGEREKAVASYVRGEELLKGTPYEQIAEAIFKDYKAQAYRRAQK